MARHKLAKLQEKTPRSRKEPRLQVAVACRCRIGGRAAEDVLVTDLAAGGCRIRSNAVGVSRSEAVELDFGGAATVSGKLEWNKGGALGVSFDAPLDEAVLDRLNAAAQTFETDSPREHQMMAAVKLASKSVH